MNVGMAPTVDPPVLEPPPALLLFHAPRPSHTQVETALPPPSRRPDESAQAPMATSSRIRTSVPCGRALQLPASCAAIVGKALSGIATPSTRRFVQTGM